MFIPLYDGKPLAHITRPYVTWCVLILNVLIYYVFQKSAGVQASAISYGLIPSVVQDIQELPEHLVRLPEDLTYISYAFLHGDFMHLLGNMLFFWVFADNVEDAMGHVKFAGFFLLCAIGAGAFHVFVDPSSVSPLIGASGAVAGVVAAYLMLHPKMKIWILALGRIPLKLSAMWCLGGWVAYQFFQFVFMPINQVSWSAHVGGLAVGAILVVILKRSDVPLFDKT